MLRLSLNVSLRIKAFEFDSGVRGGEAPVCAVAAGVAIELPTADRGIECLGPAKSPLSETLSREQAEFHFRHVEPRSILRSVHQAESTSEPSGSFRIEGLVQAGRAVRVQVVAHERHGFRLRIIHLEQASNLFRPISPSPAVTAAHAAPTGNRVIEQDQRANSVSFIFVIDPLWSARLHRQRCDQIGEDSGERPHPCKSTGASCRTPPGRRRELLPFSQRTGPDPFPGCRSVAPPRLNVVFFRQLRTVSRQIDSTICSRASSSQSSCKVHRSRPLGGKLQQRVTSWASAFPSNFPGTGGRGLRWIAVAPSRTNCWRIRTTCRSRKIDDLGNVPIRPATLPVGLIRHQQDPRPPQLGRAHALLPANRLEL